MTLWRHGALVCVTAFALVTVVLGQIVPSTAPSAEEALKRALPDLASEDFARREAGQKVLDQLPAEQYEAVTALAAQQTDPELKARLERRAATMLKVLRANPKYLAVAQVAELMAMPSSQEDPGGKLNAARWALIRDIGTLGDVAMEPALKALKQAKTADQQRDMVSVIGAVQTPAAARALIDLLTIPDDSARQQAFSSLVDRLGVAAEKGGIAEVLPALAKALPGEKDELARQLVCGSVVRVLRPNAPADKPDAKLVAQAVEILKERLKNDTSAKVRFYAACRLTEFGDNSGLAELRKAALEMPVDNDDFDFALDLLVPSLERATGQAFGNVPMNPLLSSNSGAMAGLKADRKVLREKVTAWVKTHPDADPASR